MRILTSIKIKNLSSAFLWFVLAIGLIVLTITVCSPVLVQLYQTLHPPGILLNGPPPPIGDIHEHNTIDGYDLDRQPAP